MVLSLYDFTLDVLMKRLKLRTPKRILLQFPDGLKSYALDLASSISKEISSDIIISMDPCFGGCDVAFDDAKRLDVDLIIHFGHTPFLRNEEVPVIYIPVYSNLQLKELAEEFVNRYNTLKSVGLFSTIQHIRELDTVESVLKRKGIQVFSKFNNKKSY